jgi:hypothetical protein
LWWEGCPSWERAIEIVREAMSAQGLDPESLTVTEIETDADAERESFVGSPTIRIDGRDFQPPTEDEPVGLNCRVYRRRDGRASPLPDPDDVSDALAKATD